MGWRVVVVVEARIASAVEVVNRRTEEESQSLLTCVFAVRAVEVAYGKPLAIHPCG